MMRAKTEANKKAAARDPSAMTTEINQYQRIRVGRDPEYKRALAGCCGCGLKGAAASGADINIENVWNQAAYTFLKSEYPENLSGDNQKYASVHPSLWNNGRNNQINGLFKVQDKTIYQVRGYDMANITFVRTDNGWLILDTLMSEECTEAALRLADDYFRENLSCPLRGNIKAVIISHSHVDHFGGVKAVCSYNLSSDISKDHLTYEELTKNCPIYAPFGFTEASVSENVYAGNAMGRRASYQYGSFIKPEGNAPEAEENWKGSISIGIGQGQSTGTIGFLKPTHICEEHIGCFTVDGLTVEYQMTPGTEAPAEMNNYFPAYRALWMAENCAGTLHNLYTLRGAQVRDGNAWAKYLTEAAELYGERTEVIFQAHNWPHCKEDGTEPKEFLLETASIYKFINDQTLLYINQGYKMEEAAQKLRLPYALEHNWNLKPYYGTPSHDAKAVYQRYLGWYDANPIHLNPLSPEERAKAMARYLSRTGQSLLQSLKEDFDDGKYRTVADFAYEIYLAGGAEGCDGDKAKDLCAQALEQMAYTAESGPWRNCYLSAAWELRNGKERVSAKMGADLTANMEPYMLLDYMGILYDGDNSPEYDEDGNRRKDLEFIMGIRENKKETRFHIYIRNGALLYFQYGDNATAGSTDGICKFSVEKKELLKLLQVLSSKEQMLDQAIESLGIDSRGAKYLERIFYNMVDLTNDRYKAFDIMTPHDRMFGRRDKAGQYVEVDLREAVWNCIHMMEPHLESLVNPCEDGSGEPYGDYDLFSFDPKGRYKWKEADGFYQILVTESKAIEDTTFFAPAPVKERYQNQLGIGPDGFFCKYEYIHVLGNCYRFLAEPYLNGADPIRGEGEDKTALRSSCLKNAVLLMEPYLKRYRWNFGYDVILADDTMLLSENDAEAWGYLYDKLDLPRLPKFFSDIPDYPVSDAAEENGSSTIVVYGRQLAYTLYQLYRELYYLYENEVQPVQQRGRKANRVEHRDAHHWKKTV